MEISGTKVLEGGKRTVGAFARWLLTPPVVLFVASWLIYGSMISRAEMRCYELFAAGIEAVVEHGTYEVGHSRDPWLRAAQGQDTFHFRGSTYRYSARQPGVATLGAVPYVVLHLLGYSFRRDYDLVYAIVAWTTAGLLTALAVAALFLLLRRWGAPAWIATACALGYGLGTSAFPYTGVPHHDAQATALLVIGLWLLERARDGGNAWLPGVTLGLVVFFSLLPSLVVATLVAYGLYALPRRKALCTLAGFAIGLLPTLAYNWHYFGDPFLTPNRAGGFTDTFLRPSWHRTWSRFNAYFGHGWLSSWKYEPTVPLGLVGLLWLPGRASKTKAFLALAAILHLAYILNIGTVGHSQYGPRYLIPLLPIALIGLSGWLWRRGETWWTTPRLVALAGAIVLVSTQPFWGRARRDLPLIMLVASLSLLALSAGLWLAGRRQWSLPKDALALGMIVYSVVVNGIGALGNSSYAELNRFAPVELLRDWERIASDTFPLRLWCLTLAGVWVALLLYAKARVRTDVSGRG